MTELTEMGKTAAIIGAGGFIGSRMVAGLAKLGWKVYAITSQAQNVAHLANTKVISSEWTRRGIESSLCPSPRSQIVGNGRCTRGLQQPQYSGTVP